MFFSAIWSMPLKCEISESLPRHIPVKKLSTWASILGIEIDQLLLSLLRYHYLCSKQHTYFLLLQFFLPHRYFLQYRNTVKFVRWVFLFWTTEITTPHVEPNTNLEGPHVCTWIQLWCVICSSGSWTCPFVSEIQDSPDKQFLLLPSNKTSIFRLFHLYVPI